MPRHLAVSCFAEFIGTFVFQLLGGTEQSAEYNGLLLTVCIIMTAQTSGGNLNPAVSFGLFLAGELWWARALCYVAAQLLGAIGAAMTAAGVDVTVDAYGNVQNRMGLESWGISNTGPGCRAALPDIAYGPVFLHEMVGTFVLVSTVLAAAVAKPGFGDAAPFAIGLAVFVSVGAVGKLTGGFFNPARFFGPALVFGCNFHITWLYWTAQFLGGAFAGLIHRVVLAPPTPEQPLLSTSREANNVDVELTSAPEAASRSAASGSVMFR